MKCIQKSQNIKKKSKKHSKKEYKDYRERDDHHKSKKKSKDKEISKLERNHNVNDDEDVKRQVTSDKNHYHHHYHHYHHHHHNDQHKSQSRSRSRSKSRTKDYERNKKRRSSSKSPQRKKIKKHDKIDKTKLLEIAKSNLLKSQIDAQLIEQINIKNERQQETTSTIIKSGKTINELVEYCRKLTNEKDTNNEIDYNPCNNNETTKIYHPFQIKETTNDYFKLDRLNGQKEVQTQSTIVNSNKVTISLQFPVSSGTQHRHKENKPINQQQQHQPIIIQQKESNIYLEQQSSINSIMTINNNIIIQNEPNPIVPNVPKVIINND